MSKIQPIPQSEWHQSMRGYFAGALYNQMLKDERITILTGDLGYGMFDTIRKEFPERFINVGAAEQALMGVAVGMAAEGKIPIVYSITPFLLFRPAETIRNYVHREEVPVKLIGSGRDHDYHIDGYSHYAGDDRDLMKLWPSIEAHWPEEKEHIPELVEEMLVSDKPWYINLKR